MKCYADEAVGISEAAPLPAGCVLGQRGTVPAADDQVVVVVEVFGLLRDLLLPGFGLCEQGHHGSGGIDQTDAVVGLGSADGSAGAAIVRCFGNVDGHVFEIHI